MFKKAKSNLKSNKGFTLIELIVVIAIIGILMVLAVPRLLGYTEDARQQSDEQLATLYRNTFDVLIGSGRLQNSGTTPVTITINRLGEAATITGDLRFRDPTNGTYPEDNAVEIGEDDDFAWVESGVTLQGIQGRYINRGGRGGDSVPAFTSQSFLTGITITIGTDGVVEVTNP